MDFEHRGGFLFVEIESDLRRIELQHGAAAFRVCIGGQRYSVSVLGKISAACEWSRLEAWRCNGIYYASSGGFSIFRVICCLIMKPLVS